MLRAMSQRSQIEIRYRLIGQDYQLMSEKFFRKRSEIFGPF
jgi:hypothetical protein